MKSAIITRHQESADAHGVELTIYETVVRDDLAEYATERDDLDYIPVICMGFHGGWMDNPHELVEHQQKILDTYNQKDKFIIIGFYPDLEVDQDYYDQVLEEAWGEHYLQMNKAADVIFFSDSGRQVMAEAVYEKLAELGYIEGGTAIEAEAAGETEASEEAAEEAAEETAEEAAEETSEEVADDEAGY